MGGVSLSSSTPDALWGAPALRILRPSAIAVRDLTRRPLLDRCTLTVPAGMRLLLVSEPETAASTLVRILAGLVRPSAGRVEIAGLSDGSVDGWARRVAYLGPEPGIHRWMTPREALELAARLLGLGPADARRRVERALAWVRIPPEAVDRAVARGGAPLLERTGFAAALIGNPEVLLLDEPMRSIEPHERARMLRLPGRRRALLLASRYPSSEAGLITHIGLIRDGRVRLVAPVAALEAAGVPLTQRGISDLAALRDGLAAADPPPVPAAAGR
jgi:ABC-type multidrug transport system ATPase subunit